MRWLIVLIIFGIFLAPLIALSEEASCRADGSTVVCTRTGFDTLVAKTLDARKAAEACSLMREADAADRKVLDAKLAQAMSETALARAELEAERMKPKPWARRFTALGLAAVGGVAAAVAPQVQSDAAAVGLGGLSLVSLATAALLVALE